MPQRSRSFLGRFVGLVTAGYLIGLVSIAWAVWLVSQPVLEEMTRTSLQDLVRAEAFAFASVLDRHLDAAEYLATENAVVEYTLGYGEFQTVTQDLLGTVFEDPAVRGVALYGFGADELFALSDDRSFLPLQRYQEAVNGLLVDHLAQTELPGRPELRVFQQEGDQFTHFLVAQPVSSRGLIEGVVLIEISVDMSRYLPFGSFIDGPLVRDAAFQTAEPMGQSVSDQHAQPIAGTELRLVASPDIARTEQTGRGLVSSVLQALVVVLALPFLAILVVGYRVIVAPQQQLERSERALTQQRNELAELAAIVEAFHDAIATTDADQRILWVNPAFARITGFSEAEAIGRRLSDFMQQPGDNEVASAELDLAYDAQTAARTELLYQRADQIPVWVRATVTPVEPEADQVHRFAVILTDITTHKAYEQELQRTQAETQYRSLHDSLTGLPNRRYFDEVMAPLSEEVGTERALLRIDLDHFKAVNDSLGHAAGDHVLCVVADLMREICDPGDFPARVGGDEFLILMDEGKTEADAEAVCLKLGQLIARDIPFENSICRVGASFGVATSSPSFLQTKELLVSADAALYKSKEEGRGRITLYTPALHADVQESRQLCVALEEAIESEQFEPFFQPQFDARTGGLVGVEALARWMHPEHGPLLPSRFLDSVERLSLTDELDSIIYRKGLKEIEKLHRQGFYIPKISFNVSTKQIENAALGSMAESFSLPNTVIALEILESVVIEEMSDEKLGNLFELRDRGFRLELDDFGSGHASIAGLLKLRPDVIKIDNGLVRPVVNSSVAQELISSIVDIGRALDVAVTAEGAETKEHVEILRGCGCRYLQGFYFSHPIPATELARRLAVDDFPGVAPDDWTEATNMQQRQRPA